MKRPRLSPHRAERRAGWLTFAGVVGQDGARPHLLALDVLAGAGLGAGGPRRPVAEHAVPRAGHLAGHGLRRGRGRAQAAVHLPSWEGGRIRIVEDEMLRRV